MSRSAGGLLLCLIIVGACATPATTPSSGPTASSSAAETPPPTQPTTATSTPEASAAWLPAGNLRESRNATHVAVVGTGEVLVLGSDWMTSWLATCGSATGGSDSVELGDPMVGTWEKAAGLPSRREAPVLVALPDGRALLTGGETGEDGGPAAYSSTYVFDPGTGSWSRSGLLNTARSKPAAAALADGRVLVAGGLYIDARQAPRVLDGSELWDPTSDTWVRSGRLAKPRWGASAVALTDGRILIVGGVASMDSAPAEQGTAEIYDPGTGSWSSAGSLTTARAGFSLVALADGGAIVVGGVAGLGTEATVHLSSVERWDSGSNTWSRADDLPVPRAGATAIRLADGRVLVAGGSVQEPEILDETAETFRSGLTADAEVFDPETGAWTATAPLPSPRAGASGVLLADGSALVVGGSASEGYPGNTPGCPVADPQVLRYVAGR